jgi:ribose 5-phosphate isomerase B
MTDKRIAIAADHAGVELKKLLVHELEQSGYKVTDLGTHEAASCDYPDFAHALASSVAGAQGSRGVLVCGTGVGMSMAANRHAGVRAVVCSEPLSARMARQHNDANVLCLGARVVGVDTARDILHAFLGTEFEGGRHTRRVNKIERG